MQKTLDNALANARDIIEMGATATYIPELGNVDKNLLGICVYTQDGKKYKSGNTEDRFTIQSISKVISLAIALEVCGFDTVFRQVGMEPSGDAFNSLIQLDLHSDHPFNPMINSGALAITSYLVPRVSFDEMLKHARTLCMDENITINEKVFRSEMDHIARNKAIAYLLQSKGVLESSVNSCLDYYVRMCSLQVTAESLANFGLILAMDGVHPVTGERLLDSKVVQTVKTIMLTCGMYDGSGKFAVEVGVPTKSGVGGGLLSVVNNRMGIGIFGPSLDEKGNSIAGQHILKQLSEELHLHMFANYN